jgi:cytochrome c oxidase subunit 3
MYFHGFKGGFNLVDQSLTLLIGASALWWRDVIRESTIEGYHTERVLVGLSWGMILFIVSEIMFFFTFFWSYFYFSFNPSIALGGVWPPMFMVVLNPFELPLLNTILLLSSGVSLTWSHHSIVLGNKHQAVLSLIITILFGIIFSGVQLFEYYSAPFSMSDSVYGSIFYLSTGFHGFHVFVGTCFLVVCLYRLFLDHFTREQHFGFEAAAWYWHFVDIVWLFLYIVYYLWGSF